jgi:hemin uptake protein HemP
MNTFKPAVPVEQLPTAANAAPQNAGRSDIAVVIDSDVVLQGRTAAVIAHRGLYYRLQATRQGKLILTK